MKMDIRVREHRHLKKNREREQTFLSDMYLQTTCLLWITIRRTDGMTQE